ncbi:hypothetical protein IFM89_023815 [Coptis chinensis]|uniref:Uncharacterized protein n=1 Tax=Coptis chinensis TaxID=261450 RepID=A0A835LV83_9MAGN|nr:hypothetical protein IFM89_023815 [Coptis chinensis]
MGGVLIIIMMIDNKDEEGDEIDFGNTEGGGDPSEIGNENENEEEEEEDNIRMRRRRDLLRLRIRDFTTRATSGRNRILDWSEILMGLEDHTMQFRVEIPEWDGKGAPPASKSTVSALKNVVIAFEEEGLMCAICKEGVPVGEKAKKMPCGHGFELPTDDPEYEEQRKKRSSSSSSTVGGSSNS